MTCGKCGQPIPEKRLKAVPLTIHCVPCAETLEAGGKKRIAHYAIPVGQPEEEHDWLSYKTGELDYEDGETI